MKKNIMLSLAALAMAIAPVNSFAEENADTPEEETSYTVTFLDFDGEVMQTIEVKPDEKIDYSLVDTSPLHSHLDMYTEQAFNMWSSTPEYVSEDTTIHALYKRATISAEGSPEKTEYYSKGADIRIDGLSILIRIEIQTPIIDENGDFYVSTQIEDITGSCYIEKNLEELFADDKTATVDIIPVGEDKPIFSYEITLFENLGNPNGDDFVDAVDASFISGIYAELSTGRELTIDENTQKICDVNRDGMIDAKDATYVSMYYSELSTSGSAVWENIVPELA